MSDALTDVRFWAQVLTDSKRTVVCSPENESRCKGYVTARGLGGLIKILVSPIVRDDQLIIMDEQAMEASLNQAAQSYGAVPLPTAAALDSNRCRASPAVHTRTTRGTAMPDLVLWQPDRAGCGAIVPRGFAGQPRDCTGAPTHFGTHFYPYGRERWQVFACVEHAALLDDVRPVDDDARADLAWRVEQHTLAMSGQRYERVQPIRR